MLSVRDNAIHEGPEIMRPRQNFGQRKVYGIVRVSLAIIRLGKAETKTEKEKACDWVVAWLSFTGVRRFKANRDLDPEGSLVMLQNSWQILR